MFLEVEVWLSKYYVSNIKTNLKFLMPALRPPVENMGGYSILSHVWLNISEVKA